MALDYYVVKSLYDAAIEMGSDQFLIDARDQAMKSLLSGNDALTTSVTTNGKTIVKKPGMTTSDLLKHIDLARDYYRNGPQGSLGFDYSSLMP